MFLHLKPGEVIGNGIIGLVPDNADPAIMTPQLGPGNG
jgi:hypothetical protein